MGTSSIARVMALMICAGLQAAPVWAAGGAETVDQARLEKADAETGNWLAYGRTYSEQRFSPLKQIDKTSVGKLGLAWSYETQEGRAAEATPIIVDGVMYVTSAWGVVYALDARTGKQQWVFDPKIDRTFGGWTCCDVVNRGVAVWKGKVYVGTTDGRLIAINAKDGTKVWDVVTIDQSKPYTITGAPRVAKGLVFIGNGGAEFGVRGFITAYDAETGALKWRFYTVPGDPAKGPDHAASDPQIAMMTKTWTGEWWKYGGGGTVWDSIVYDAELDQLIFGVGNGSPWNRQIRSPGGGDNLFLSSIVAVKPETGEYLWHFQETPGESWDFTASQPIMLATLKINGADRKVLMHAPKNGFFYVLDRTNGKFISGKNLVPMAKAADTPPGTPISWAYGLDANGRPLENIEARYIKGRTLVSPSAVGAHNWHPMSYSPQTGLVYLSVRKTFMEYVHEADFTFKDHNFNLGVAVARGANPNPHAVDLSSYSGASLVAWDPVAQKEGWRVQASVGGTLATAGDLVFVSEGKKLAAYDAHHGHKLWDTDAGMSILNAPITYQVDGVQYVEVMTSAGVIGGGPIQPVGLMPKARVLVYKLGGTASIPAYAKPEPTAKPPVVKASAADIAHGQDLFNGTCLFCHGGGANGNGAVPDLRRSPYIQDDEAFRSVVAGALAANGMPNFGSVVKPEEASLIRAYIAAQADKLYTAENKPK